MTHIEWKEQQSYQYWNYINHYSAFWMHMLNNNDLVLYSSYGLLMAMALSE